MDAMDTTPGGPNNENESGSSSDGGQVLSKLFQEIQGLEEEKEETEAIVKKRNDLLASLKTAMGGLTRSQIAVHVSALNLEVLFTCLASESWIQVSTTCDILNTLMNILDPLACLEKYQLSIMQGFSHPVDLVRSLIMTFLTRCILADENCLDKYPNIRVAVICQLGSEELSAAQEAHKFLMKYGATAGGAAYFKTEEAVSTFKTLMTGIDEDDVKMFRILDTVTIIATYSNEHYTALNTALGMMDKLFKATFNSDDILGQATAIEVLANLVGCPHGQEVLKGAGVFAEFKKMCDNIATVQNGELLLPGIIKFIGKIGAVSLPPKEMVALVLTNLVESGKDYSVRTVSIEAFSYIGSTLEGKQYYKTLPDIKKYFELIRELIMSEGSPTSHRARVMDAMAFMFGSDESNEDCLPHWFNVVIHDMSEVFDMAKLPFPELRLAALTFMAAVAHLEWAQRHYLRGAGVVEFLISRSPEPLKECVYAKYRLVKILVDSPTTGKFLTPEKMAELRVYIQQGPFYSPTESAVATMGGS